MFAVNLFISELTKDPTVSNTGNDDDVGSHYTSATSCYGGIPVCCICSHCI